MDPDNEIKAGYLLVPPHGAVLNKISKKKTMQQKFCRLYGPSKQGIERLEIYENKDDEMNGVTPKIITLENCIKITNSSNTITIVTKTSTQHISAATELDTADWLFALQSVAFKNFPPPLTPSSIDEDNDLYCSSEEGIFSVNLYPSEASIRCGLEPIRYILILTPSAIELRDQTNYEKIHATWPYRYIRRYGYRQDKFTFEAGRKCQTGEGIFHLEHPKHYEIYKCLSMKMKSMKQILNVDSLHSPDHSDCHKQLQSILGPRSRSPLPQSVRPGHLDLNRLGSNLIINSSCIESPTLASPGGKKMPIKPPRKTIPPPPAKKTDLFSTNKISPFDQYAEPVGSLNSKKEPLPRPYDCVEMRTDAWKTYGVDCITHEEHPPQLGSDGAHMRLISPSQDNLNSPCGDSSRIIVIPSPVVDPEDKSYDRLKYFGSTNKLNNSSMYKQIDMRPCNLAINELQKSKDTWNDYDEVENVMQPVRLADDSHLGYGIIRKRSTPGPQVPTAAQAAALRAEDIEHCESNGTDYAIVSRPKNV